MSKYKIISDSACDLSQNLIKNNDIDIVSLYININDSEYLKENIHIKTDELYDFMINNPNASIKTSLPSTQDYIDKFKPYLEKKIDILCICLNGNFSGSYQSAVNASNILKEFFPSREIIIIDSKQATGTQGLLVLQAAQLKDQNYNIKQSADILNKIKNTGFIVFTVDTLEYLQKGGRIGKISSITGTLLNIKPIITLENGELKSIYKIRGRKKAINYIINVFIEKYYNTIDNYDIVILQSACKEDSNLIYDILKEKYKIKSDIKHLTIGGIIGTHTGPKAIGIGCIKKFNCK